MTSVVDHVIVEVLVSTVWHLYYAQDKMCFYCDKLLTMTRKWSLRKATKDHFVPRARGGPSSTANYVIACAFCNNNKGSKMPTARDWVRFMVVQATASELHARELAENRARAVFARQQRRRERTSSKKVLRVQRKLQAKLAR